MINSKASNTFSFIRDNFFQLATVVLLIVLMFMQKGCSKQTPIASTEIRIDTVWVVKDTIVIGYPQLLRGERDTLYEHQVEYVPSDSYEELVMQFDEIKQELFKKNTYTDTFRIDSVNYIAINDELQRNMLKNRKYDLKLKYPEIVKTETITKPYIPKSQLYIGGGIGGNKLNVLNSVEAGLMFKTKKDHLIGIGVQKELNSTPVTYELKSYWKIHF